MKPAWLDFLKNAGAEIDNNKVTSFGNVERERRMLQTGLIMCDLSHQALISIDGEDSADFLQGQLTNDVRDVSLQHSQLSAYCTHKGRMLANFRLFKRDDSYYIRLPQPLLETILKRISMFILMANVSMKDSTDALVKIGLSGPDADQQLTDILSDIPTATDDATQVNGYTIIKCAGSLPRYEIYGELEDMKTLWGKLDVNAAPAGSDVWETLDIQAGIPTITEETSEAFVPQMTNMHVINGVNFQKGCYTGQEIVARMQYLGKLKRRMFKIQINTSDAVSAGDKLFSHNSKSGQGTGQIVNAQIDANGGTAALAVIDITDAEAGNLQLHDENGPTITVESLPYSIE
jgi:tRNA-modifying protein YgfZ